MNAEEMAKEGFYLVKSFFPHDYRQRGAFPHPLGRVCSWRRYLGAFFCLRAS